MSKDVVKFFVEEFQNNFSDEYGFDGDSLDDVEIKINDDEDTLAFHEFEESKWDDQGKYQYCTTIYEVNFYPKGDYKNAEETGVFVRQNVQRSGSYFGEQHYMYDPPEFVTLKEYKKTVTIREWV